MEVNIIVFVKFKLSRFCLKLGVESDGGLTKDVKRGKIIYRGGKRVKKFLILSGN